MISRKLTNLHRLHTEEALKEEIMKIKKVDSQESLGALTVSTRLVNEDLIREVKIAALNPFQGEGKFTMPTFNHGRGLVIAEQNDKAFSQSLNSIG